MKRKDSKDWASTFHRTAILQSSQGQLNETIDIYKEELKMYSYIYRESTSLILITKRNYLTALLLGDKLVRRIMSRANLV